MSVRTIKAGTTDVSVNVRIIDSTDGTPETGVVFNTSGIDLWYRREGEASNDITEATLAALTTTHTDGGFLHINDGWYRLDLPDAACATGVSGVQIGGTVTGMVVLAPYIELVAYNPYDAVRLGLTAMPNAAADAAGGLPISDAGGLDLDVQIGTKINDILTDTGTTLQAELDGIQADTEDIQSKIGTPADTIAADIAAIEAQTDDIGVAGAGLTAVPWNADWDAQVESEVNDALIAQNLDHLVKSAVDTDFATTVHADSIVGYLADNGAGFDRTTDSLEAIRDRGDAAWTEVSASEIRDAVGLAAADLDTQINILSTQIDSVDNFVDTEVAAIKAKTDNLPSDPADASDIAAAIAALNDVSTAEVNAEVVDALNTDTYGETSGVPSATATLVSKISRLYDALISGLDITSTKKQFKNAAGSAQWEKDLSDDGTTYTETSGNAP